MAATPKFTFTSRITREMRQALGDEAARTGRTVAQVAEQWLEAGRFSMAYQRLVLSADAVKVSPLDRADLAWAVEAFTLPADA